MNRAQSKNNYKKNKRNMNEQQPGFINILDAKNNKENYSVLPSEFIDSLYTLSMERKEYLISKGYCKV